MPSSNRKNSVDIRGSELNTPKAIGHKETGTTMSSLSATSLTLDSGVLVYNAAGQSVLVTHTGASGVAEGDNPYGDAFRKLYNLHVGEQIFIECDNLQDILVANRTIFGSASDTVSFEAH